MLRSRYCPADSSWYCPICSKVSHAEGWHWVCKEWRVYEVVRLLLVSCSTPSAPQSVLEWIRHIYFVGRSDALDCASVPSRTVLFERWARKHDDKARSCEHVSNVFPIDRCAELVFVWFWCRGSGYTKVINLLMLAQSTSVKVSLRHVAIEVNEVIGEGVGHSFLLSSWRSWRMSPLFWEGSCTKRAP